MSFDDEERIMRRYRACGEKLEVETKKENILRVIIEFYEVFTTYRFTIYVYRWRCAETL